MIGDLFLIKNVALRTNVTQGKKSQSYQTILSKNFKTGLSRWLPVDENVILGGHAETERKVSEALPMKPLTTQKHNQLKKIHGDMSIVFLPSNEYVKAPLLTPKQKSIWGEKSKIKWQCWKFGSKIKESSQANCRFAHVGPFLDATYPLYFPSFCLFHNQFFSYLVNNSIISQLLGYLPVCLSAQFPSVFLSLLISVPGSLFFLHPDPTSGTPKIWVHVKSTIERSLRYVRVFNTRPFNTYLWWFDQKQNPSWKTFWNCQAFSN